MAVSFGRSQLKNPTPSGLSGWIKALTVIIGILIGWIGTAPFIPANTSTNIQSVLGLLLALGNGILPFFGVTTEQSQVPIDDVSEMKPDTDNKPD